ncbi:ribosome maturation factor RimM [Salipaludibacillus daqingensis]|uniref:ribosome maturation factor RimM n=1 Tax=Salipaludibacillus daqingensis TaxID=3041001 RepID=UPI002475464A|nr:ribosome maturation factor RimM [Salipaludibacillus daqingensis]
MTEWLNVGKIVNTHGIRGEVRVISSTDFPDERYATGNELMIMDDKKNITPVKVSSWRRHKQFDLITFDGFENLTEVEKFKGSVLKVDSAKLNDDLLEGEFYYHEIIGLTVYTDDGEQIGKVKEILSPGANDVWVVEPANKGKDILIPYIDSVVKHVDTNEGKVVITPMEGLLD